MNKYSKGIKIKNASILLFVCFLLFLIVPLPKKEILSCDKQYCTLKEVYLFIQPKFHYQDRPKYVSVITHTGRRGIRYYDISPKLFGESFFFSKSAYRAKNIITSDKPYIKITKYDIGTIIFAFFAIVSLCLIYTKRQLKTLTKFLLPEILLIASVIFLLYIIFYAK